MITNMIFQMKVVHVIDIQESNTALEIKTTLMISLIGIESIIRDDLSRSLGQGPMNEINDKQKSLLKKL